MAVGKIDNLAGLTSLIKLQLDNNSIAKIENLSHLTTLEVLDLSFNRIKRIEGLDSLARLRELSLSANEIEETTGLDALAPRLETLSLSRNKISSAPGLLYLRKFPKLTSLALAGNSIPARDCTSFALAHLPGIRYLDFRMVEESARRAARLEHAESLKKLETEDAALVQGREDERRAGERLAELKEADLLGVETLFADLVKVDNDLASLSVLPTLHDPREEYSGAVNALAADFKRAALEQHHTRLSEKAGFAAACARAIEENDAECSGLVAGFEKELSRAVAELEDLAQVKKAGKAQVREACEAAAGRLRIKNAELVEALLEREVQLCEQIEVFTKAFDKKMSDIDAAIVATTQAFFGRVRDAESQFHERVGSAVLEAYEAARSNPSGDVTDAMRAVLSDKDALMNLVGGSRETQVTHIDGLLEEMKKHELQVRESIVSDARAEENQRDRARCGEIWQLQQHNISLIDKVCLKFGAKPH